MSRLNVGNLYNENEDGAPVVSGISTFSSPHYFVPPSGSTAERPSNPGEGMIRFNTDSGHLEYYSGQLWVDVIVNNNNLGVSTFADGISARGTGTRGLIMGGEQPGRTNTIEYITIDTLGNAQNFGDLLDDTGRIGSFASRTRGFRGGGYQAPASLDRIDFVTIASTGDATDFGNLTDSRRQLAGCSNQTRGVFAGGYDPTTKDVMDYITMASTGDAVDFGNLISPSNRIAACSSSIRGIFAGGAFSPGSPEGMNIINYVTISSTGNGQDFGDLVNPKFQYAGCSNTIRGVFGGARTTPDGSNLNSIDFITIATLGDSQDFGDLTTNRTPQAACSSSTRAIWAGGNISPAKQDTIDFVTIMTTGNAVDFGDMITAGNNNAGCSNGHGGL